MSVKSTRELTRRQLEELYAEKKMSDPAVVRQFRVDFTLMIGFQKGMKAAK